MGELNASETVFQLHNPPRINCNQAALFTDKRQKVNSPMFKKRPNGTFQQQFGGQGALSSNYMPDSTTGTANYASGTVSQAFNTKQSRLGTQENDYVQ